MKIAAVIVGVVGGLFSLVFSSILMMGMLIMAFDENSSKVQATGVAIWLTLLLSVLGIVGAALSPFTTKLSVSFLFISSIGTILAYGILTAASYMKTENGDWFLAVTIWSFGPLLLFISGLITVILAKRRSVNEPVASSTATPI
jgi:hypothetical protein